MVESIRDIETKPYLVALNEIIIPESSYLSFSKADLKHIEVTTEDLKSWKCNFSLPIVCLAEDERKYHLLTGLPIYKASADAELQRIWFFLIASQRSEAEEVVEQILRQSYLNKRVITEVDIEKFLAFINNKSSVLTKISGIGPKFAQKIAAKRPYKTKEQFQEQHGKQQSLKWINAFTRI
jgi:hypothetical protein